MTSTPEIRPLQILLVENHPDTVRWLTLYLEDAGHHVTAVHTLSEAREALSNGRFDVLISDIGLPDGTGWELMENLQLGYPLYAVAMSGFGMSDDSSRSLQAGYRHHLLKPFRTTELDRLLAEAAAELPPHT